jgi:hypothetical protein
MSERLALLFSDGSILILPPGASIEQARKEALSCDENESNPQNFTTLLSVAVHAIEIIEVPSEASKQKRRTAGRRQAARAQRALAEAGDHEEG